jgi:hypothetical protein
MSPLQLLPLLPAALDLVGAARPSPRTPAAPFPSFEPPAQPGSIDLAPLTGHERARTAAALLGQPLILELTDGTFTSGKLRAIRGAGDGAVLELAGALVPLRDVRFLHPGGAS